MKKTILNKIFEDNFRLYQRCTNKEVFNAFNEIYKISQNNSMATEFCFTLSHVIIACTSTTDIDIDYNIYDVMCDYYNVMDSHLYIDVMTTEEWNTLTSEIKKVYAKYQSKYVSDLGIAIINTYEKEQNEILLKKLKEKKEIAQLLANGNCEEAA